MSDLISRQAALDAIRKDMYVDEDMLSDLICCGIESVLNGLPSAEPPSGEWLEKEVCYEPIEQWQSAKCSVCERYHTIPYLYYFSEDKFCPNCGARMTKE